MPTPAELLFQQIFAGSPAQPGATGQPNDLFGTGATVTGSGLPEQAPPVQQPQQAAAPQEQQGGGFLQKLLQVLQNPAVQRTAGLGVSAAKSPADLRAFQRQEQLNLQGAEVKDRRETSRRSQQRLEDQHEFDKTEHLISVAREGVIGTVRATATSLGIDDEEIIQRYETVERRAAEAAQPQADPNAGPQFVQGVSGQQTGEITQGGPPLSQTAVGPVAPPGRTVQGRDAAEFESRRVRDARPTDPASAASERLIDNIMGLESLIQSLPPGRERETAVRRLQLNVQQFNKGREEPTLSLVVTPEGLVSLSQGVGATATDALDAVSLRQNQDKIDASSRLLNLWGKLDPILTPGRVGMAGTTGGLIAGAAEQLPAVLASLKPISDELRIDSIERVRASGDTIDASVWFDPGLPQVQSLLNSLAYAVASMRETGKLTDADVKRARDSITGGNPIESAAAIRAAMAVITEEARDQIELLAPRIQQDPAEILASLPTGPRFLDEDDIKIMMEGEGTTREQVIEEALSRGFILR